MMKHIFDHRYQIAHISIIIYDKYVKEIIDTNFTTYDCE